MSNSSQEFSFGGSPPRACPGTVGESPQHEGNSPEQLSQDSYEVVDNSAVVQVIEEVKRTPVSSRNTSPVTASPIRGGTASDKGGDKHVSKSQRQKSRSSSRAKPNEVSGGEREPSKAIPLPCSLQAAIAHSASREPPIAAIESGH